MARWRMGQAIGTALAEEMREDPTVVLLGEDVGAAGGVFKTSDGLLEEFGPQRVRDTPIAEMGFLGLAVGAACAGFRPVAEIMFVEFAGVALDQISTEAAKMRYLSQGAYNVPIVVRMSAGPGLGFGAQHSQTLETWFANTPGLTVACASGPNSAYGLVRAAVRDDDPVVLIEPRILYGEREEVDLDAAAGYRLGAAQVLRRGTDVTVVALGQTVPTAMAAAESSDVDMEVIDLATVWPWDVATVVRSARKTGRLVTVEANPYQGGWGAHVVAEVVAAAMPDLTVAPLRITCPDVPTPYSGDLERIYVPSPDGVRSSVESLIATEKRPAAWWEEVVSRA